MMQPCSKEDVGGTLRRSLEETPLRKTIRACRGVAWVQVSANDDGSSKVVLIADFLPDSVAPTIWEVMDAGMVVMKKTLDRLASTCRTKFSTVGKAEVDALAPKKLNSASLEL
jgi:hypothetical protein